MIEIKDPVLKRLLLEHLVEQMDQGHLDPLLEAGVWPELLDTLRERPARDLINASQMDLKLRFTLDCSGVVDAFNRLDAVKRDIALKEYFVIGGAAPELMTKLFKLTSVQIRQLREVLCPAGEQPLGGRPRLPEIAIRESIQMDWAKLAKEQPQDSLRERLYQLHLLHSDISINSLWAVLNEFDSVIEWDHSSATRSVR